MKREGCCRESENLTLHYSRQSTYARSTITKPGRAFNIIGIALGLMLLVGRNVEKLRPRLYEHLRCVAMVVVEETS